MKRLPALLRILAFVCLLAFLISPMSFAPLLSMAAQGNGPVIYERQSLWVLALQHLGIVFAATIIASAIAIAMAIFVTRRSGTELLPLARSVVNIGQTFPPVAVLALAVPATGFGVVPTFLALFLYAMLPIFENTLTGLSTLPRDVQEAAKGVGMTGTQRLFSVELPLCLPLILAGIRVAVVISLSTATIGSTVAAPTLGEVIIAGLQSNNFAYVLQGAVVVAMMAVLIHDALYALERRLSAIRSA